MRVPFSWLREYCDPGLGPHEVAELLSTRAVEVERVSRVGVGSPEGFVVGKVVSAQRHPNADRLSVCEVDTGGEQRTIVCGAPNVAAGQTVPVALPGAVLPDGRELGRAELRGVVSDGMILSEAELDIGDDADGIIVLSASSSGPGGADGSDEAPAPGTPLDRVLPVGEPVLELELNPNRSDCLGIYGVAREVHAITGAPLAEPPWEGDAEATGEGEAADYASVTVEVPELCPRFTARVFTGIEMGPSPLWMKARLLAAGQRPISNVVDVTNYVMLLTAQPLHAFDLDRVRGRALIIRTADEGEKMTTLDGAERAFDSESVLVCDGEGPVGIAGIMGGQIAEVSDSTTSVLLEVATWNGVNILRTSTMLGLRSEASTRFEKQLHQELAIRAQRVASKLLVRMGATLVRGTLDAAVEPPPAHVISLHGERVESLLGIAVPTDEASTNLGRLGFGVEETGERQLTVTVTPERHYDVTREVDMIEEVGRLHGFDRLPRTLPKHGDRAGRLSREQRLLREVADGMRDLGLDEVIAWSFVSSDLPDRLRLSDDDVNRRSIAISNPLSEEQAVMRTTLLGRLLDVARYNLARHSERVAVFEMARVFLQAPSPDRGGPASGHFAGELPAPDLEPTRLGCLAIGPLRPASWRGRVEPAGFYEVKGILEAVCGRLDVPLHLVAASEPFLHPGRSAAVELGGVGAGWIGELHPLVAEAWDLPGGAGFEIDLGPLVEATAAGDRRYEDVTTYPAVFQDLAVIVPDELAAERVRETVLEAGGDILRSARLFDLYRGEQLGEGRKSLALELEFRSPDRTLTDEEVAERRAAIKRSLDGIGGSLRE